MIIQLSRTLTAHTQACNSSAVAVCVPSARSRSAQGITQVTSSRQVTLVRASRPTLLSSVSGVQLKHLPGAQRASRPTNFTCRAQGDNMKLLAVFPEGGKAAENENYVCCAENGLGIRELLDGKAEVIITADKEGSDSEFEKHLPEAEIVVTTPFHPAYLTRERIEKAKKLKLIITAGIGSDHVDLHAAADAGLTVAEVSGSNTTSVAEDNVLRILLLMRNYLPAHQQILDDKWDVPAVAGTAFDLMDKTVGTVGGGAIGFETMKRLRGFDVKRLYFGRRPKEALDKEGVTLVKDLEEFLGQCDVVTVNVPLTDKTRGMFNKHTLSQMKKGAYLINNARGAIVDKEDLVEAVENGQIGGYSGDVWDQQPPPKDHPWKNMPNNAMTPHISGTTLDAQKRYLEGTHGMLKAWLDNKPFEESYYIVREGELASQYQ